jgi:hypothetical protein
MNKSLTTIKRRILRNKTKKNSIDCKSVHKPTYRDIHQWYQKRFEQLGWIVLAKKYGYTEKLIEYKTSLERLLCALHSKMEKMRDQDKKDDLKIMHQNVTTLLEHFNRDVSM